MISIIIPVYNKIDNLKAVLTCLKFQTINDFEVIISDDGSTDSTKQIIQNWQKGYSNIYLFQNSFKNVIKNFEFAISMSRGDIIFLSDQDDIWHKNKIQRFKQAFDNYNVDLVISDLQIIDEHGVEKEKKFFQNGFKYSIYQNILKNNFIGCSMAFKKNVKNWILPFPANTPMHDWWIGLVVLKKGRVYFLHNKLIYYRRHMNNVTSDKHASILRMFKWRVNIMKNIMKIK